jgi:hypothetical protein
MPLTSSFKELEAILQKLIKNVNLGKIQNEKTKNTMVGVDGDADELLDEVVGSVQQTRNTNFGNEFVLTRTGNEKRKPFKLCLVKRMIYISYKLINMIMIIINSCLIPLETLILRLHILWLLFILNKLLIFKATYIMVIIHIK